MLPRPWNPCDDGIVPIAEALERLCEASHPTRDTLAYQSTQPSSELGDAFSETRAEGGRFLTGRREAVRRWLQTNGFGDDAREFDDRLTKVISHLRDWEQRALHLHDPRDWPDVDNPDDTERGTGYSRRIWQAFDDVQDEAAEAASYLRQLATTLRSKLQHNRVLVEEADAPASTEDQSNPARDRKSSLMILATYPEDTHNATYGEEPLLVVVIRNKQDASKLIGGLKAKWRGVTFTKRLECQYSDAFLAGKVFFRDQGRRHFEPHHRLVKDAETLAHQLGIELASGSRTAKLSAEASQEADTEGAAEIEAKSPVAPNVEKAPTPRLAPTDETLGTIKDESERAAMIEAIPPLDKDSGDWSVGSGGESLEVPVPNQEDDTDASVANADGIAEHAWERLVIRKSKKGGDDVVELDGNEFRLRGTAPAEFLEMLQAAKGDYVKATLMESHIGRVRRVYEKLPKELKQIVEAPGRGRAGYRML